MLRQMAFQFVQLVAIAVSLAAALAALHFFGLWGMYSVVGAAVVYHVWWRVKHGRWMQDADVRDMWDNR